MGRAAVIFLLLAVAVLVLAGLPTVISDLNTIRKVRPERPAPESSYSPTFELDAPRRPAPQFSFADNPATNAPIGDFLRR